MLQRIVITVMFICFPAMLVVSAFDHRFGWSVVPVAISAVGDVLVAAGLGIAMLVVIQNGYAAANVTVESGQTLVSTGLYGMVRHPMYSGNIILLVGMPLALGSYWGLVFVLPGLISADPSNPRRRKAARRGIEPATATTSSRCAIGCCPTCGDREQRVPAAGG